MRTIIFSAHILFLSSLASAAVGQLPPEILADSYMLEVEQAFRDGDHTRARAKIREILQLQTEHDLNLPELDFWLAKAAHSADLPEKALESIYRYLTIVGREGRHYVDALKLMNTVQAIVRCKGWDTEEYFKKATPEEVSSCLGTGVDVEARDGAGRTLLHRAAAHTGNPIVVESLIRFGADLEAQDVGGHTPLVVAVVHNESSRVIEILIKAGASLKELEPVLQAPATDVKYLEQALESVLSHMAPNGDEAQSRSEMRVLMSRVQAVTRCKGWDTEEYFKKATLEEVSFCLDTGVDLEARDDSDRTPLHRAAIHSKHPAVVEALLKAGGDVVAQNGDGRTSLHLAAASNQDPAIIQVLLAAGGDVKARDDGSDTPLHLAALSNENVAVIQALLTAGADVKARNKAKWTPVLGAARNENLEVIKVLIKAGGDIRVQGDLKITPLHLAAGFNKNPEMIEFLLGRGGDPKKKSDIRGTPLHWAAVFNENAAVTKVLLDTSGHKKQLKQRNKEGLTPLQSAAKYNRNAAVIKALLNAGGDQMKQLEQRTKGGWTLLHMAAENTNNPEVVKLLIDAGSDLNATENTFWSSNNLLYWTPLHSAAGHNEHPAVIKVLLDAGADPNRYSGTGSALHTAAKFAENPAIVQLLLDAGADPNKKFRSFSTDEETPLHDAARYNEDPAIVNLLLKAGAHLEATNGAGLTPLHMAAAFNKSPAIAQTLIDAGADLKALDEDGLTPLQHASKGNENPAVRQVFLVAGAGSFESQRPAAEARRIGKSGPGFLEAAIGIAGGTAIAAVGGGTEEALAAGTVFAESVLSGQSSGGSTTSAAGDAGNGNEGTSTGSGQCEIPGYPNPGNMANLGLSSCPATVDFQVRSFALQAAGAQCAIATGSASTPEQIQARRQEIKVTCERLAALGVPHCRCP